MVYIVTYGCKVNHYESLQVLNLLNSVGVPAKMIAEKDIQTAADENGSYGGNRNLDNCVFVVNSCAVTGMAEKKSRYGISKIKKHFPSAKIYSMGCAFGADGEINGKMGQNGGKKTPQQITAEITGREIGGVGTGGKTDGGNGGGVGVGGCGVGIDGKADGGVGGAGCGVGTGGVIIHRREKAFIKVQDGCKNFCSFCIIPYIRNELKSREIADITAEISAQPEYVKQIVLSGINLCNYKTACGETLGELCLAVNGCGRKFYISSLEPPIITEKFVRQLKRCRNFEPKFHICLQSGSDKVLCEMNRHYTAAEYLNKINLVRANFPNARISTDIIVGYPTETDGDFADTMEFVKKIKFSWVHIFPYSPRTGTAAAGLKPITNSIVTKRFNMLRAVCERQ